MRLDSLPLPIAPLLRLGLTFCVFTLPAALTAQDAPAEAVTEVAPEAEASDNAVSAETAEKSALQALLSATQGTQETWEAGKAAAREAGLSENQILQYEFVNKLRKSDTEGILSNLDTYAALEDDVPYGEGEMFSSASEFRGVIDTYRAVAAFQNEDWQAFEGYVKDAFWRAPLFVQGVELSSLVHTYHAMLLQEELMQQMRLPLELELSQTGGEATTLGALMEGNKAVLLDFWASWCAPCMQLMPVLKQKAAILTPQGIVVAGMNTDQKDPAAKASQVHAEQGIFFPWLIEPENDPYSSLLGIDSIPRMVLVGPEGQVLFNGHPLDEKLTAALQGLGVQL